MKINYNIDHKLLNLPVFQEKRSALNHIVLFNCLCMIQHFTKHKGQCQIWINQIAEDYNCNSRVVSLAIKTLINAKLIKQIKPWNHKTKEGGWYMASTKQVPQMHQTGAPSTQVNNTKLFKREDVVNTPPPFKKEWTFPSQTDKT